MDAASSTLSAKIRSANRQRVARLAFSLLLPALLATPRLAFAHRCTESAPPDQPLGLAAVSVLAGGSATYTIFGSDTAQFTVQTSPSSIAAIMPTTIGAATDGVFALQGLQPGAVDIDIFWEGIPNEENPMPTEGICRVTITVQPAQPSARLRLGEQPHACGQTLTLDASESTAVPGRTIVTYEWDLDGDGQFDDATGPMASTVFTRFGTHPVAVRVTDDGDPPQSAVASTIALADNRPPVADANGPYGIVLGETTLLLDGTGSSDPNEPCGDAITDYSWDVNGDGSPDASGANAALPPEELGALGIDQEGSFPLYLHVTDRFGLSALGTTLLTATAPAAKIDLAIEKSAFGVFKLGSTQSYEIIVTNVGTAPTTGEIVVTDTLPPELEYVSFDPGTWDCPAPPAGPVIVCRHPGPLAPGNSLVFELRVRVRLSAVPGTTVTNVAEVRTDGDGNAANNEAEAPVEIRPSADLAIEKSAIGPFVIGASGIYRITITNVGSDIYTRTLTVVDTLPEGLIYLGDRSEFACNATGQEITCIREFFVTRLAPGESTEIEITVGVVTTVPGVLINTAVMRPEGDDADPSNNGPVSTSTEIVEAPPPEEQCEVQRFAGFFAPSQGVWQDDDTFVDLPTKQLTRVSDTSFIAELPMVQDRPSLLFGILRPAGEPDEDRRDKIVLEGAASGLDVPVRVRFTLAQGGEKKLLFVSRRFLAPLGLECGASKSFRIEIDASEGIPPPGVAPFTFDHTGPYQIVADLIRADGTSTGLEVVVTGDVKDTGRLDLHFVAGALGPLPVEDAVKLLDATDAVAQLAEKRLTDYAPLAPGAVLTTVSQELKTFTRAVERADADPEINRRGLNRLQAISAELAREVQSSALLSGVDRIVVFLSPLDYALTAPLNSAARAPSEKAVFVEQPINFFEEGLLQDDVDTVYHEIVHTLPYLWSDSQMLSECDLDWHNEEFGVAHGHRILLNGVESRMRQRNRIGIMGPVAFGKWSTQCVYWHVLHQLLRPLDPELLLVQGRIIRDGADPFGELHALYDVTGTVFREPAEGGDWAIVLRDTSGTELGRFRIDPEFRVSDPGDIERDLVPFSFLVPRFPEMARVELLGPPGDMLLDAADSSANPPSLQITAPAGGSVVAAPEGTVGVAWAASDADNDPLLATVLYSSDAGATWRVVSFEQTESTFAVPVAARRSGHRVKVVVSDGTRSVDAVVSFALDLDGRADLAVKAGAYPGIAVPGHELRYTLVASNGGPADATEVTVTSLLPTGATFQAATTGCAHESGIVRCAIGDLRAGSRTTRTIVVQVEPGAEAALETTVAVAGAEPDPEPANDTFSLTTPLAMFGGCPPSGISPTARVHPEAVVSESAIVCDRAVIGKGAVIGDAAIVGERSLLLPWVRVDTGAVLERNAQLLAGAVLGPGSLLGEAARVGPMAFVGEGATVGARSIVAQGVALRENAHLAGGALVRGSVVAGADLLAGENSRIEAKTQLGLGVTLGANTVLGPRAVLGNEISFGDDTVVEADVRFGDDIAVGRDARIGRRASIGDRVTIGDGARIRQDAIVPAGTVVPDGAVFP